MTLITRKTLSKETAQREVELQEMKRLLTNRERILSSQDEATVPSSESLNSCQFSDQKECFVER